jgi:phosphotriesterase-related protein
MSVPGAVTTVLGPVPAAALGTVDYHDHLFQVSPLLPGDELDSEPESGREAAALLRSGFTALVDATPIGLGRRPEAVARISAGTGLRVVAATGFHREAHYRGDDPLRELSSGAREAVFRHELTLGQVADDDELRRASGPGATAVRLARTPGGDPIRAGLIKTGIDYWRISRFERITLEAAAAVHVDLRTPIMVHLEFATAAHEVLDLLATGGVDLNRVVLAHADRDPDPELHLELVARGAYLGYDGMARPRGDSEAVLLELTRRVVEGGGAQRILLGADVARRSRYVAYGGMPGLAYLGERYLPRLRRRLPESAITALLVENPARLLAA